MKIRTFDTEKTTAWALTAENLPPTMADHALYTSLEEAQEALAEAGEGYLWSAQIICVTAVSDWEPVSEM